ncbi:MAG: s-adenosyl-l-methionine-dependent methyltransferase [Chthoniobacteraceae bacterium]|nr:s-adenosyl-l-methionine-dependent methyltransferase [Chthoniobacteraceae bacterium]
MKLSTIRSTLAQLGTQPTRSLGQNFLHDQNIAEWMVAQLDIQPGETWVELGPGLGALTEYAVRRSPKGILIEKDGRLADFLRERYPHLEIIHGDAAEYDVRQLFARGPVKVFGNLPYYVSSQIMFQFTAEPSPVCALSFTLQKELAERLSAEPRTKAYGALTLLVGRRWRVKYLRTLPPTVFTPEPKVDSAVVMLTPRERGELPECDGGRFTTMVKQGFSQRRKQLRKMLAPYELDWPAVCAALKVEQTVRAEELSLAQWIELTNIAATHGGTPHLTEPSEATAQDIHGEIFDVVDENDTVRHQASRHDVHLNNWRHRAVHIFVFDEHGQLFLQKRSKWKDKHPQMWDSSAAGHVNAGHDYEETARREIEEELGVSAELAPIGALPATVRTGWEFVRIYRASHDGPFTLNPSEIESGAFFSLDQIQRWVSTRPQDFAPGFLECWKTFRALE